MFKNILSNAIKFTKNRQEAIITIDNLMKRNELLIQIRDNGIGFDMKYSNKIFNMFQRLHSDNDYEGVGAGLAIAKKIVERHGGKIWVNSNENIGTEVSFTIPMI